MNNLPRPRSHLPAPPTPYDLRATRRAWTVHPSPDLISEGVVAGYIHDISIRHRGPSRPRPGHPRGDQR